MTVNNSSFNTATYIPLSPRVTTITDTFNSASNPSGEYFRFILQGRSSFNLSLTGLSADANIELYDSSRNLIPLNPGNNTGGPMSEVINRVLNNAGTYFVRVLANGNGSSSFNLSLSAQPNTDINMVLRNQIDATTVVWNMSGANVATSNILTPLDNNWDIAHTGDYNWDGLTDVFVRNKFNGQNIVWLLNSTAKVASAYALPTVDNNWQLVTYSDFNNDGIYDMLLRSRIDGTNIVWNLNSANQVMNAYLLPTVDTTWEIPAVADFNGDGQLDLLFRNRINGSNVVFYMNGPNITGSLLLPSFDNTWHIASAPDINSDGQPDLVIRNRVVGVNQAWILNSAGQVTTSYLLPTVDNTWNLTGAPVRYLTPPTTDLAGNTLATAFNIGSLVGQAQYRDAVNSTTDPSDYYRFTLTNPSTLNLAATTTGQGNSLSPLVLLQDTGGGQTTVVPIQANMQVQAGTYYVQVAGNASFYNLTLDASPLQLADLAGNLLEPVTTSVALNQDLNQANGGTVDVKFQVRNLGNAAAGQFKVSFYLSRDTVVTPNGATADYALGTFDLSNDVTINSLAANSSTGILTKTLTLPKADNFSAWNLDGTYYIAMVVDSANTITESSEVNNFGQKLYTVGSPTGSDYASIQVTGTLVPDLIGDSFAVSGSAGAITVNRANPTPTSAPLTINYRVRNQGNVPVSSQFRMRFYLSADSSIDTTGNTDLLLISNVGNPTVDTLANGADTGIRTDTTFTLPASNSAFWQAFQPGTYTFYVGMAVDASNAVLEGDEANNSNRGAGLDFASLSITIV